MIAALETGALVSLAGVGIEAIPDPRWFHVPYTNIRIANAALLSIGFLAQALFTLRILTQLWATRKEGESVIPPSFWYFSLTASMLYLFYGWVRSDPVLMFWHAVMVPLYLRNIYMIRKDQKGKLFHYRLARAVMFAVAIFGAAMLLSALSNGGSDHLLHRPDPQTFHIPLLGWTLPALPVLIWGFIGSVIFMFRFVIQWWVSEKTGHSANPASFWATGAVGSFMLLIYFFIRSDPPPLIGQLLTIPTYLYNLSVMKRASEKHAPSLANDSIKNA